MTKWSYPGRLVSRLRLFLGDQVNLNLSPNICIFPRTLGRKGWPALTRLRAVHIEAPDLWSEGSMS